MVLLCLDNWCIFDLVFHTWGKQKPMNWINVKDELPEGECLACYTNQYGGKIVVRAKYFKQYEAEQSRDEDYYDYCEADDTYYIPKGWYELVDNWEDYASFAISEGEVAHWMAIPTFPKGYEKNEAQKLKW